MNNMRSFIPVSSAACNCFISSRFEAYHPSNMQVLILYQLNLTRQKSALSALRATPFVPRIGSDLRVLPHDSICSRSIIKEGCTSQYASQKLTKVCNIIIFTTLALP